MEDFNKIEVRKSAIEGKGIFAKEYIKKGETALLLADKPWMYANHSCNPNCGIKDKMKLVAIKSIKKDEEITFDYATLKLRIKMQCQCGSPNCRKML